MGKKEQASQPALQTLKEYAVITAAVLIMDIGIYVFKFPNNFSFGGIRCSGSSGSWKIRFYIRAFSGFYGKSGIESCNFCSDTVCNGYYGTDCEISR